MIDGNVADEVAEGETLEPRYYWAKLKIAIFNYRKLFGLTADQVREEPFDEFILNAKIDELISEKISRAK